MPDADLTAEVSEFDIEVTNLSPSELDDQPFGIIRLDSSGRVLSYNAFEERLARRPRNEVVGKNFFLDVAPCTRVRGFYGRFLDGMARGSLRVRLGFVFEFEHGRREVEVSMLLADDASIWIIVRSDAPR